MISTLVRKCENMFWETRLGISTRGLAGVGTADDEHIHYGTVPYRTINTILDGLQLSSDDVFVDLGCGKGRVLCCAALRPIKRAIGIECSIPLSAHALRNIQSLRIPHRPLSVVTMEAQQYDYNDGTVFYMFHPFGPDTLAQVLDRLRTGLERVPRNVRIVYVNPVHNHVLQQTAWLTETERWNAGEKRSPEHSVAWWHYRNGS